MNRETYLQGFKEKNKTYYGEASVVYLGDKSALARIKKESPQAKLIILLRDPVKRAISHYHHRRNTGVDKRSFGEILLETDSQKCYPIYYSSYKLHLEYLFKNLHKENIHIVISEKLFANPQQVLNHICSFLNLEKYTIDKEIANQNEGSVYRSELITSLQRKIRKSSRFKSVVLKIFPGLSGFSKTLETTNKLSKKPDNSISSSLQIKLESILSAEREYIRGLKGDNSIWNIEFDQKIESKSI
jgi:hypothetical protein